MGACDYFILCEVDDTEKVAAMWRQRVEEDGAYDGHGPYAGNATTFYGDIRFHNHRLFDDRGVAEAYILENHQKREAPIAVRLRLPSAVDEKHGKRIEAAKQRWLKLRDASNQTIQKIADAFRARKSAFVGCPGCHSKLSHQHLCKPTSTTSVCPLCDTCLLSQTDQDRIKRAREKETEAQSDYADALKPKPSDRIGWLVGGWASC